MASTHPGFTKTLVVAADEHSLQAGPGCRVHLHIRGFYTTPDTAPTRSLFITSSGENALSFTIGNDQTIPGLENAALSMRETEQSTIEVPPEHAFGPMGNPHGFHGSGAPIPPNSTLIFEAEMAAIEEPSELESGVSPAALQRAQARKDLGNVLFRGERINAAVVQYDLAAKALTELIKSGNLEAQQLADAAKLNQAACLLKLDKHEQVERLCREVLEHDPSNTKAKYRLAKALTARSEFDEAEKLLRQVVADENTPAMRRELALVQREVQRIEQQQRQHFGGMFDRLAAEQGGLYQERDIQQRLADERQSRMRKCTICDIEVEDVQYARHMIKAHSGK